MSTHSHKKGSTMLGLRLLILTVLVYNHHTRADKMPAPFKTYDFNRSWSVRDYNGRYIPIPVKDTNGQLIYVSGALDETNAIQLDFQDQRKSCVVPLTLTYNSVSKRTAHSLGNGKVIVTLLNNQVLRTDVSLAATNVEWRVTIIDPKDCTSHHLTVAKVSDNLNTVLPYENTFDVLLKNMDEDKGPKTTKIVRYNDSGEVVKTFSSVISDVDFLKVLVAKEYDPSKGYYYIVPHRQQGVSTLRKLNSEFEVVKSYDFQHSKYTAYDADAYSVDHGRFSICYFDQENRKSLKCLIVDEGLSNVLANVRIPYERDIYYVTVRNLPDGGIMIVYAVINEDRSNTIYVQYVGEDEKVSAPVEFGMVPKTIHYIYDFEIKDGSYCISITTIETIMTKCIVPPKA